jgi:hypothetical protein
MDSPHDNHPEDIGDQPAMPMQAELEAMLDADEADMAAGRVVPLEPVLARMRATAERIRHERDLKEATAHRHA